MLETITRRFSDIVAGLRGKKLTERNVGDTVRLIRQALLEADVALPVVKEFVRNVKDSALGLEVAEGVDPGQQFIKVVHEQLAGLMGPTDTDIEWRKKGPTVILLAGLQGSGKTTTCAKLARFLRDKRDRRPIMVAADLQRPAAIEQLKVLGEQLSIPVFHEPDLTPPKLCDKAVKEAEKLGCDTVILDTAGRLHIDDTLMSELADVAKHTRPEEIFLVCDSMTGQDAVHSAAEFNERLELSGIILTKLDGDARGGAALSVKHITGKTIKFIGVGEKLDRLEEFHPDRMAQRILGMGDVVSLVEQAQEKMDQKVQQEMQEKLANASFNLDDFLTQLGQIKKMGSMRDMLSMIPGIGGKVDELDLQGNEINQVESIIQSMTKQERHRPEVINTSRRQRIARGCGREIAEVNDLLKQFKMMKGIMDEMHGHGSGIMGKMKGIRAMRKKLKGGGMDGMAGPNGMPDPSAMMMPGMGMMEEPGPAPRVGPSKKEIQKKRKAERDRKRKNRKAQKRRK